MLAPALSPAPRKTVLIISGSSSLAASEESAAWAKPIIDRAISAIGPRDLVFSGENNAGMAPGKDGPDLWIRQSALAHKRRVIEFRLDGFRYINDQKTPNRWHDPFSANINAELERYELFRNDKLAEACAKAMAEGWDARGLFVLAKEPKNRFVPVQPVPYMLQRVESVGVYCDENWFGEPEISEGPLDLPGASEIPVVWIDLETGGRNPYTNAITEIGCVLVDTSGEKNLGTFEHKVMPHFSTSVESEAARITGFSLSRWREEGAIDERTMLLKFIEWAPKRFVWGGYNGSFDRRFLQQAVARHGLTLPVWIESKSHDPLMKSRATLKKSNLVENCQLGTICKFYGINTGRLHSALSDALSAWMVWQRQR